MNSAKPKFLPTSAAALTIQILLQFACGLFLHRAYIADPAHAYQTMKAILGSPLHAFVAGVHYWGSVVLIVHSFLHVAIMLWTGAYRPPQHWRWFAALGLFGCAMLLQITGNLMPFDRHAVETAVVEGGIAASVPVVGRATSQIVLGDKGFDAGTLARWSGVHQYAIPVLLILALILINVGRIPQRDGSASKVGAAVPALIVVILALVPQLKVPLGDPATVADYTTYGARVSWYTWPMHGALTAFNKLGSGLGWIGATVLPGIVAGFLVLLPWLSKRMTPTAVRGTFSLFVLGFLTLGILFGGSFAPLVGNRDPAPVAVSEPAKQNITPIDPILAKRGLAAFNTVGCSNCHGQDGKQASVGPDLSKVNEKYADPAWFTVFVRNPPAIHKNSTMPSFAQKDLSEADARAIAEYLSHAH